MNELQRTPTTHEIREEYLRTQGISKKLIRIRIDAYTVALCFSPQAFTAGVFTA